MIPFKKAIYTVFQILEFNLQDTKDFTSFYVYVYDTVLSSLVRPRPLINRITSSNPIYKHPLRNFAEDVWS